jgi:hypothetical protein
MEKKACRTNYGVSGPVFLTTSETFRLIISHYIILLCYIYVVALNVSGIILFLINTK